MRGHSEWHPTECRVSKSKVGDTAFSFSMAAVFQTQQCRVFGSSFATGREIKGSSLLASGSEGNCSDAARADHTRVPGAGARRGALACAEEEVPGAGAGIAELRARAPSGAPASQEPRALGAGPPGVPCFAVRGRGAAARQVLDASWGWGGKTLLLPVPGLLVREVHGARPH